MTVASDIINITKLSVLDTRLRTVEINKFDKFGSKYSMHKIAHAKYWDMHIDIKTNQIRCKQDLQNISGSI